MTNQPTAADPYDVDVLVVGAGPVGTALAIDLIRRGLTVRVIDRAEHGFDGSRAKGVQPRTLEVFDDLGALDDVLAGGSTYPLMGIHLGPITVPWRMLRSPHTGDPGVPHPHTWLIPQHRTDAALHDRLTSLGGTVEYRCDLTELTQTPDTVTATRSTPDGTDTVTARYVVGADGGASTVRRQAGIGFVGTTDDADRMLIIDATVDGGLSRNRWHVWPGLRGRFVGACPLPHGDQFQWMIKLGPDETPPAGAQQITDAIRASTGNKRLSVRDVTWTSVFRPNIRLAEHYRSGRILLAGDAAHVHTPAGAQGLNTGVQDSYNLGWKLAQVIAGAPDGLLDTYESERQPIAAAVLGLSTEKYRGMGKLDPSSIKRDKDEQQLAITYRGGPLAPNGTQVTTTLAAGDRAPDAHLATADAASVRLFDVYRGPHFTALAYGPAAAAALTALPWPVTGAGLTRVSINAPGVDGDADHVLRDTRADIAKSYGISGDTLLVIRPDGYLASAAAEDMLAATRETLRLFIPA